MEEVYKYIVIYDEVMKIIKNYQNKRQEQQIMTISIINNFDNVIVDIGLEDINNQSRDIKTMVLDIPFNDYVLSRIAIKYNNWYKTEKEQIIKSKHNLATYVNVSTVGDMLNIINYPIEVINYIRCLLD